VKPEIEHDRFINRENKQMKSRLSHIMTRKTKYPGKKSSVGSDTGEGSVQVTYPSTTPPKYARAESMSFRREHSKDLSQLKNMRERDNKRIQRENVQLYKKILNPYRPTNRILNAERNNT